MLSAIADRRCIIITFVSLCEGKGKRAADAANAGKYEAVGKSGCNISHAAGIHHCICPSCQLVQCEATGPAEGRIWIWWEATCSRILVAQSTHLPYLCTLLSGLRWRWNWRYKWLLFYLILWLCLSTEFCKFQLLVFSMLLVSTESFAVGYYMI